MKPALAIAFQHEMDAARDAWRTGDLASTFEFLERAHILGQRHLYPHALTHVWMLRVGLRRRDRREVVGQTARLFATLPMAMIGWVNPFPRRQHPEQYCGDAHAQPPRHRRRRG